MHTAEIEVDDEQGYDGALVQIIFEKRTYGENTTAGRFAGPTMTLCYGKLDDPEVISGAGDWSVATFTYRQPDRGKGHYSRRHPMDLRR